MIHFEAPFLFAVGLIIGIILSVALVFLRKSRVITLSYPSIVLYGVLAMLAFALLGNPYTERVRSSARLLMLLDVSDSMDVQQTEGLLEKVHEIRETGVAVDVLPFAKETASIPIEIDSSSNFSSIKSRWQTLDVGRSNISEALETLLRRGETRALLVSDGFETESHSSETVRKLGAAGVKVYPIAPEKMSAETGFQLSHLHAPLVAPPQSKVDLRVSLQNTLSSPQRGTLIVTQAGKEIYRQEHTVQASREELVELKSDILKGGVEEIVVSLMPENDTLLRSSRSTFIATREREKVLLVAGSEADNRFLQKILEQQKFQLDTKVATSRISLTNLTDYSLVIFNNVSYGQFQAGIGDTVERFVAGGGRFLMIGGDQSFGLGGYKDTSIEDVLPVAMVPPHTEKKRLNVAVELVLDKSRSMLAGSKIEYAKESATQVIRNLKDDDFIGVIGFDTTPFIAIPIMQVGKGRRFALERVSTLFPTGKTNLYPAIDEGRRSLVKVPAGRKHMIVLTDGRIPDAGAHYIGLVKKMRDAKITVSTVMMGGEADTSLLRDMAEVGGGSFYQTTNARNLPRIFLSDIKVSTGEKTLKESREYLVRLNRKSEQLVTQSSYPPLRGYVQTKPKRGAEVNLITTSLGRAEPLLAWWDYKKGRTAAYTSDTNGRWSNYWVPWPGFQKFWVEVLEGIRPKRAAGSDRDIRFEARYFLEGRSLVLDVALFDDPGGDRLTGTLTLPGGKQHPTSFESIAAGRYQYRKPKVTAGKYVLNMNLGSKKLTPVAFNLSGELFGELKGKGFDLPALSHIANITGGKLNPLASDFLEATEPVLVKKPATTPLLFLMLLLLLIEIFLREFGFAFVRSKLKRTKKPWRQGAAVT